MEARITEMRSHGQFLGWCFYFEDGDNMLTEFDEEGIKMFDSKEEAIQASKKFKESRKL